MNQYGRIALGAAAACEADEGLGPWDAWQQLARQVAPHSPSSQTKACPRTAFLRSCEEGRVSGIAQRSYIRSGRTTRQYEGKESALVAIDLLADSTHIPSTQELWTKVKTRRSGSSSRPQSPGRNGCCARIVVGGKARRWMRYRRAKELGTRCSLNVTRTIQQSEDVAWVSSFFNDPPGERRFPVKGRPKRLAQGDWLYLIHRGQIVGRFAVISIEPIKGASIVGTARFQTGGTHNIVVRTPGEETPSGLAVLRKGHMGIRYDRVDEWPD